MLYKEFEAVVSQILNGNGTMHAYIPYGNGKLDLAEAKIIYRNGKIYAEWKRDNCDYSTEAEFIHMADGRCKVHWYSTYHLQVKLAD